MFLLTAAPFFERLPRPTAPALLIHSRSDRTALPAHRDYVFSRLGSPDKEAPRVEKSNHIIVEDSVRGLSSRKPARGQWHMRAVGRARAIRKT